MAAAQQEREVITEFIELYRGLPCLWDFSLESYKDNAQKQLAWDILVDKLKEIDDVANIYSAKKKISHLRSCYKREAKKVLKSKYCTDSAASGASRYRYDVHRPSLWYFNLLTFLDKEGEQDRSETDPLMMEDTDHDDDEPQMLVNNKRKGKTHSSQIKRKKEKLIVPVPTHHVIEPKKKEQLISTPQRVVEPEKINSFGLYVGEKLDQVSPYQRQVAEKLISEVIFLANTNNLRFDSRIETPSSSQAINSSDVIKSSPSDVKVSPSDVKVSLSDCEDSQSYEGPTGGLLKELLILKK